MSLVHCAAIIVAIERLNEEYCRRIMTRTVPMLLWALLATGQSSMRKVKRLAASRKPDRAHAP